jgi:hypothetical protein
VAFLPLDPQLHLIAGWSELQSPGTDRRWRQHFQITSRLEPGSWSLPESQARACAFKAPSYALSYWQQAIDRSGWRAPELFQIAVGETRLLPGADTTWAGYAQARPELLLSYAQTMRGDDGRPYFEQWWRARGAVPQAVLTTAEIEAFYDCAAKWGTAAELKGWMRRETSRVDHDYLRWAQLLHRFDDDEAAWALLSEHLPEPAIPPNLPKIDQQLLERRTRTNPDDFMNVQLLACTLLRAHADDAARSLVVLTAARDEAPDWFRLKAANRAVELLLHDKKPR